MENLHQLLEAKTKAWRKNGYPCEEYPVISEILEYQLGQEPNTYRFLRKPQFEALETYWYLRLAEKTPHIFDLYKSLYPQTV